MGRTPNPSNFLHELSEAARIWIQSLHKAVNGNVDMGSGTFQSPILGGINDGVYTQFTQGNSSGVLIRVAANGVSGTGAPYNWPFAGAIAINHGLLRLPIGFKVVDKDKTCDVFRTVAPNSNTITLQCTDKTASVTLYVF